MKKIKVLTSLIVTIALVTIVPVGANASQWVKEDNSEWKYLNNSNTYATGWVNDNGIWYFMNANGIMQTGWLHDTNGKWYYLNQDGSMARNTTINEYTLGNDGAWVSGGTVSGNTSGGTSVDKSSNTSGGSGATVSGGTSSGSTVAPATSGSTGKVNRDINKAGGSATNITSGGTDSEYMQNLQRNKK